jgi:hypothetical protein
LQVFGHVTPDEDIDGGLHKDKIEFANLEVSKSNLENDVLITLNDNTQIAVLNASGDFTEGVTDRSEKFFIENAGLNADNFSG